MTESAKKVAAAKRAAAAKKAGPSKTAPVKKSSPAKAAPAKKSVSAKAASKRKAGDAARILERAKAKADSAATSKFFKRATNRARRIADDPEKLREIAEKADRTSTLRSGPFAAVLDEFRALIRLVVAYARGHYRQISIDKLIIVVGGLIYVVSPVDVIPDAIPGLGVLDDVSVIAWVLKSVRDELDAFREWETGRTD